MKIKQGYSRLVLLIGNYAIKVPKNFGGMLCCLREKRIWKEADLDQRKTLCPVLAGCAFFIVMRRGKPCFFPLRSVYHKAITSDLRHSNYVMLQNGATVLCDYGQFEAAEPGKNIFEYREA